MHKTTILEWEVKGSGPEDLKSQGMARAIQLLGTEDCTVTFLLRENKDGKWRGQVQAVRVEAPDGSGIPNIQV